MVFVKSGSKIYDYPDLSKEIFLMNKRVKDDFAKFCKEHKIIKSKLVEEFYRTILIRYRTGTLDSTNGHISINVLTGPHRKRK